MARIEGDENDNRLSGEERADRIFGFGGEDTIYGGEGGDRLDGGAGDDVVYGDATGPGRLPGDDTLYGRDGDDALFSDGGSDLLDGGEGQDSARVSYSGDIAEDGGTDTAIGGGGYDTFGVSSSSASGGEFVLSLSGTVFANGAAVAVVSGFEGASFSGERGAYKVTGTEGKDFIDTGAGDDTLAGGAGDDEIRSQEGDDRVDAGDGDDVVTLGDAGRDRVDLGAGDDTLDFDFGRSDGRGVGRYDGGEGNDLFDANLVGFSDRVVTFDGQSLAFDGVVIAELTGFEAIELAGARLTGLSGDDFLSGSDSFDDTRGTDRLVGRGGDDGLEGYGGRNVLIGGAGNDNLEVDLDALADRLDGGAGEDRLELDNADEAIVMTGDLQAGVTVTYAGETAVFGKRFESIEVLGSYDDDVLIGGVGDDSVGVGEGSDVLSTFGGDDRVFVALDDLADRIDLGEGTDAATLTAANDEAVVMREGAGGVSVRLGGALAATIAGAESFVVTSGDGDDRLLGGDLTDALSAGAGRNTLLGRGGDDLFEVALDGPLDRVNGGAGVDRLIVDFADGFGEGFELPLVTRIGDDGALILSVAGEVVLEAQSVEAVYLNDTDGDDRLIGLALDDVLRGRFGVDTLIGGAGDDLLFVSREGATLQGGAGSDTASFEERFGAVEVALVAGETVTARYGFASEASLSAIENVIGTGFDDKISGDDDDNVIEGGEGDDSLAGGAGVDTLSYASSEDGVEVDLAAGRALESIDFEGFWTDTIEGFENVTGSARFDRIAGDDGANRIEGGRSGDILTGRAGADIFVFAANETGSDFFGFDSVTDFSSAEGDRIDLSAMADAVQAGGELAFVGEAAFSGAAGEIRYASFGKGIKLLIDLDGDAKADETILLGGLTEIARDDLILA